MSAISIYWFRDDLRLSDLPGLKAAAEAGPIIPVYILDNALGEEWRLGSASRWWLHHSLAALRAALAAQGVELILRAGDIATNLMDLVKETGANHVYCSRHYQPWAESLELNVREAVTGVGATLKRYPGHSCTNRRRWPPAAARPSRSLRHSGGPAIVYISPASPLPYLNFAISADPAERGPRRLAADTEVPKLGLWLE